MTTHQAINLDEKFDRFRDQWSPKIIAALNDYLLKIVRIEGEFVWHRHEDTDELFFVVDGAMHLELRDGVVALVAGDLYIVPKGVDHRPVAERECRILLMEPADTINTGDTGGPMTVDTPEWI